MRLLKPLAVLLGALSFHVSTLASFTDLQNFGANPGSLEASFFSPQTQSPPLVVCMVVYKKVSN
jgi:hypothetical protein